MEIFQSEQILESVEDKLWKREQKDPMIKDYRMVSIWAIFRLCYVLCTVILIKNPSLTEGTNEIQTLFVSQKIWGKLYCDVINMLISLY